MTQARCSGKAVGMVLVTNTTTAKIPMIFKQGGVLSNPSVGDRTGRFHNILFESSSFFFGIVLIRIFRSTEDGQRIRDKSISHTVVPTEVNGG